MWEIQKQAWVACACVIAFTMTSMTPVHSVDHLSSPGSTVDPSVIEVREVVVDFSRKIDVPARQSGAVSRLNVRANQFVRQSDVLGQLDGQALQIRRRAASLRFESAKMVTSDDLELRFAETSLAEAEAELEASQATDQRFSGTVSANQLRRMRLAVERARLEVAQTKKQRRRADVDTQLAATELAMIDQEAGQLDCVSPIDGVVLNVHREVGEWIAAGQPWFTVATAGELTLHALVDANELAPATCIGLPVSVHWGDKKTLRGKVVSVDPTRLPGNRFRLHAEVENQRQFHDKSVPPRDAIAADSGHTVEQHWQLVPGTDVTLRIYRSPAEMAWRASRGSQRR